MRKSCSRLTVLKPKELRKVCARTSYVVLQLRKSSALEFVIKKVLVGDQVILSSSSF